MSRLRERYVNDVMPVLRKEFGLENVMAVPRVTKVVVNMGLGEGTQNAKIVDNVMFPEIRSWSFRGQAIMYRNQQMSDTR